VFEIEMISDMSKLPSLFGQPQIGVEGHQIRNWTDEMWVNPAKVGHCGILIGIERKSLAKIQACRGKWDFLIGRNQV